MTNPRFRSGDRVLLSSAPTRRSLPASSIVLPEVGDRGRVEGWTSAGSHPLVVVLWDEIDIVFAVDKECLTHDKPLPDFSNLEEVDEWLAEPLA